MNQRFASTTTIALVVFIGCARTSQSDHDVQSVRGAVNGGWSKPARIVFGKRWAASHDIAVGNDGIFDVPAWAHAVTAYIDANGNHAFDRFAEPSAVCKRTQAHWDCEVPSERATLHRTLSARDDDKRDHTYALWEDYRSDGTRFDDSELCLEERCTSLTAAPFLAETAVDVHALAICGREGFEPRAATVRGSRRTETLDLQQPPPLRAEVRVQKHENSVTVSVDALPLDRAIVWSGVSNNAGEITRIYWTSESDDSVVSNRANGFDVQIPKQEISRCERDPKCTFAIQLLRYWKSDAIVVSATEYRQGIDLRSRHEL